MPSSKARASARAGVRLWMPARTTPGIALKARACSRAILPAPTMATRTGAGPLTAGVRSAAWAGGLLVVAGVRRAARRVRVGHTARDVVAELARGRALVDDAVAGGGHAVAHHEHVVTAAHVDGGGGGGQVGVPHAVVLHHRAVRGGDLDAVGDARAHAHRLRGVVVDHA